MLGMRPGLGPEIKQISVSTKALSREEGAAMLTRGSQH